DRLLEVDREKRTPSATALVDSISAVEGSAQGQRRLASMVEAMRGGPSTRMHVRARQEDPDTELSPAGPLPSNEPAPEAVKSRALRRWGAAALVAALLLAGALFVFRSTQTNTEGGAGIVEYRAPKEDASLVDQEAVEPSAEAEADPNSGESMPDEGGSEEATPGAPGATEEKRPQTDRGWVRVVVQPWGNVWIDGVWMGRAPVTARVPEGRHLVEVGRDLPAKKRVVRIAPGERKNIELSLGN
ncbi:MAG: hypothetical protein AAF997_18175, partial [Myxococcota bacterium]